MHMCHTAGTDAIAGSNASCDLRKATCMCLASMHTLGMQRGHCFVSDYYNETWGKTRRHLAEKQRGWAERGAGINGQHKEIGRIDMHERIHAHKAAQVQVPGSPLCSLPDPQLHLGCHQRGWHRSQGWPWLSLQHNLPLLNCHPRQAIRCRLHAPICCAWCQCSAACATLDTRSHARHDWQ